MWLICPCVLHASAQATRHRTQWDLRKLVLQHNWNVLWILILSEVWPKILIEQLPLLHVHQHSLHYEFVQKYIISTY